MEKGEKMKQYLKDGFSLKKVFKKILGRNGKIELVLPNFQREYKWDTNQQKELLASFLVNIPIGSFLILEGNNDSFNAKKIGYRQKTISPNNIKDTCLYLLDGQQRLTALYTMFYEFVDNFYDETLKKNKELNYGDDAPKWLKNKWFIDLRPDNISIEENIFGIKYLKFDENKFDELEPEDILDYIVSKEIFKTKGKSNWYHPSNKCKTLRSFTIKPENRLVPLYEIYSEIKKSSPANFFRKIIRKIGYNRVEEIEREIQNAIQNNNHKKLKEIYSKYFKDIEEITLEEMKDYFKNSYRTNEIETKIAKIHTINITTWIDEIKNFLEKKIDKSLSVFQLPEKEIGRAITIFEHMNMGGVELDTYDLIVAKAARKLDKPLTKLLEERIAEPLEIPEDIIDKKYKTYLVNKRNEKFKENNTPNYLDNDVLKFKLKYFKNVYNKSELNNSKIKKQFLNLLSIITYKEEALKTKHLRRNKKLKLNPDQIAKNWEKAIDSLIKGYAFMHYRLGLTKITDPRYVLMVIPISYCLRNGWFEEDVETKYNKIEYWYWVSLFSGKYNTRQSQNCIKDIEGLDGWVKNDNKGKFIKQFEEDVFSKDGYSDKKLLTRKSRKSKIPTAVKRGIIRYIISKNPFDLDKDVRINSCEIANEIINKEDHHIIPTKSLPNKLRKKNNGEVKDLIKEKIDSPLNKTPILKGTNNTISNQKIGNYLQNIKKTRLGVHFVNIAILNLIKNRNVDEQAINDFLKFRFDKLKTGLETELETLRDSF